MVILELEGLSAGYGRRQVLKDITFAAVSGEITGLLGKNGCGKTTLLKACCGILPYSGSCRLAGRQVRELSPRELAACCGYVPQRNSLGLELTAIEVVLMGMNARLGLLERPDKAMKAAAAEALRSVGLGDRLQENYQTLSEGQKQKCLLARASLSEGRMFFLDEPESALDFDSRYGMGELVRTLVRTRQGAALVSLHDPQLALALCDRLLLLREGRADGILCPKKDSAAVLQAGLERLYGPLEILERYRNGERQLAVLREAGT